MKAGRTEAGVSYDQESESSRWSWLLQEGPAEALGKQKVPVSLLPQRNNRKKKEIERANIPEL